MRNSLTARQLSRARKCENIELAVEFCIFSRQLLKTSAGQSTVNVISITNEYWMSVLLHAHWTLAAMSSIIYWCGGNSIGEQMLIRPQGTSSVTDPLSPLAGKNVP